MDPNHGAGETNRFGATGVAEVERWNYEVEHPLRPPHEIAEVAWAPEAEQEKGGARPTLRRGSRGAHVRDLQLALNRGGEQLTADGEFGPRTEQAVRSFQSRNGLTVDGIAGPRTWQRLLQLDPAGAAAPPAAQPSPGLAIDSPTGTLGTLVLDAPGRSFTYPFTRQDLEWTAKLLVHEAGGEDNADNAAVLWAMFNHYAFFRHTRYPSFSGFIRAYSTTLQPELLNSAAAARHMHRPPTVFVRSGGVYPGTTIPRGQLQRHLDIQAAPWASIKASARRLATRALRGELPNPGIGNANEFDSTHDFFKARYKREPSLEEWRAYTEAHARRKKLRWVGEVPKLNQRNNAFYVAASIANVPPGAVRVDPPAAADRESYDAEAWLEPSPVLEDELQYDGVSETDEAGELYGEDFESEDAEGEDPQYEEYESPLEEDEEAFEFEGTADEAPTSDAPAAFAEAATWAPESEDEDPTDEDEFGDEAELAEFEGDGEAPAWEAPELEAPAWEALEQPADLQPIGEIRRSSAAYVRWVQESLNRVANAALTVDGVSGPRTRNAIRQFQASRQLTVDGVMGPQTERAMQSAGASPPPGASPILAAAVPTVAGPATGAGVAAGVAGAIAVQLRNALLGWVDPVAACRIEVVGHGQVGTTANNGSANLNLAAVPDGTHRLRMTPRDVWTARVGPGTAATAPRPTRMWRPLEADITVRAGRIVATAHPALQLAGARVTARLQPVWMASPNRAPRPAGVATSLIVVHHTAGPRIGPALNTFIQARRTSAHYVIDVDGQIVKMVDESEQAVHAGTSHWTGQDSVNRRSVGIEVVHRNGAYPAAQMTSLIQLLQDIRAANGGIPAQGIAGHSDIGTNPGPFTPARPRRLGRKSGDPGLEFDWAALGAVGLGIPIGTGPPAPSVLGAFFNALPAERLRLGDRDAGQVYAGAPRPTLTGGVIADLQTKLRTIGYFCPATGSYDAATRWAVQMFQEHFMGGSSPRPPQQGQVDSSTANVIGLVA